MPFHSPLQTPTATRDGVGGRRAGTGRRGLGRSWALMIVAMLSTFLVPAASAQEPPEEPVETIDTPPIVFPVVGRVSYSDTWGACRGAGCSRAHKGVDIFAPRLVPLVAAADGVIVSERRSGLTNGGNKITIRDDEGWIYLYLHVNNDSPGTDDGANPQGWILADRLRVGDRVAAGQVIGYLGDSGNAETTPAHLHFEIHEPGGGAINPTPTVDLAVAEGRIPDIKPLLSSEEQRAEHAPSVDAWYRALLKRQPTSAELYAWSDRMAIDLGTIDDLIADLTMDRSRRDPAGMVLRTYEVALDRRPDIDELRGWEGQLADGLGMEEMAGSLIVGREFSERHGSLSDEAFIDLLYRNALNRAPTADRLADWLEVFGQGTPRHALAVYLADTYQVKDRTWHDLEVIQAYRAGLDRLPNDDEFDRWEAHLDGGGLIPDVVDAIRATN